MDNLVDSTTPYKVAIIRIVNDDKELEIAEKAKSEDISWKYRTKDSVKMGDNIGAEVFQENEPLNIQNIGEKLDMFFHEK